MCHHNEFELIEEVSRTHYSILYKARRRGNNQLVFLRHFPSSLYPNSEIEDFDYQTKLQFSFDHPNLQKLIDLEVTTEGLWLVLEFLEGSTLEEWLVGPKIGVAGSVQIAQGITRAVGYLHKLAIVHCNLSPSSIYLCEGLPGKIAGFGYARGRGCDADLAGQGLPVRRYEVPPNARAPEQLNGSLNEISPATDVYALGTILYQLINWTNEFSTSQVLEISQTRLSIGERKSLSLPAGCPPRLAAICSKCLQVSPQHRYADANALAEDLASALAIDELLGGNTQFDSC